MSRYKHLLQAKADLRKAAQAILDKAAGRALTDEETARFNAIEADLWKADEEITAEEIRREEEHSRRVARGGAVSYGPGDRTGREWSASGGSGDDGGFSDIGEMLSALFRVSRGQGLDPRLEPLRQKAAVINEGLPSRGGYAIPEQFVYRAFMEDLDDTVLLKLCDKVTMTSNKLNVPTFQDDSHSSTAPYGITWTQVPESGSFGTAQTLPFRKLGLQAHKSGALFSASNEWLSDADSGMRGRLDAIFRASLRWYVESKLWNGTGAGMALGALVGDGTISIAKEAGQIGDTIITENVVKMWARLRPGSHSRAVWVGNPTCFPQLAQLTVGVGTAGIVTSLLQTNGPGAGIAGAPATAMLGRPLYLSEHLPALGNAGDLVLCDPLLYLLGDRKAITLDSSPHPRFEYDETTFRAQVRFDGQPALNSVLTPANGDTCAWLVKIAERA